MGSSVRASRRRTPESRRNLQLPSAFLINTKQPTCTVRPQAIALHHKPATFERRNPPLLPCYSSEVAWLGPAHTLQLLHWFATSSPARTSSLQPKRTNRCPWGAAMQYISERSSCSSLFLFPVVPVHLGYPWRFRPVQQSYCDHRISTRATAHERRSSSFNCVRRRVLRREEWSLSAKG
jgi:hypothetical protein